MAGTSIPNEIGLRRALAGTQADPSVAVTPDYRWLGELAISKNAALVRTQEMTGEYDGLITPDRELPTFSGTYGERLTYQSLPLHMLYAIGGAETGATAGDGYLYEQSPSSTQDNVKAATLQYGVDGQVWRSSGIRHDEVTLTVDTDDTDGVWKLSSNLFVRDKEQVVGDEGTVTTGTTTTITDSTKTWTVNEWAGAWLFIDFGTGAGDVRQVASNTATALTFAPAVSNAPSATDAYRIEGLFTAGVPFPAWERIATPGTQFFLDPYGDTPGTTQLLDRFISFNVTVATNRTSKRFAEHTSGFSTKTGRGMRLITGQVRLEFDRRDEYEQYEQMSEVSIALHQTGKALSAGTNYEADIILPRVVWDVVDMDERENNITATFGFVAYRPESPAKIITVSAINNLATLP